MITVPAGTQIWIAAGVTDLRRGFTGLSAVVQMKLEQDPFGGHVFVFRGRRGDLIKILWWDGDGLCLFAKRLEWGRFLWPQAENGTVALTRAQLSRSPQLPRTSRRAGRCRNRCRALPEPTLRSTKPAPIAGAGCVHWAKMFPNCSNTCRATSR